MVLWLTRDTIHSQLTVQYSTVQYNILRRMSQVIPVGAYPDAFSMVQPLTSPIWKPDRPPFGSKAPINR